LPAESSVENPIDLLGDAREDRYAKALEIIQKQNNVGAVICLLTPQDQTPVEKIADEIIKFKNDSGKVVGVSFIGKERVEKAEEKMRNAGIFCSEFPEQIVELLNKYYQWSEKAKNYESSFLYSENSERKSKALEILNQAKAQKRKALLFPEAAQVMELYEIKTINFWNPEGSEIKFPVVLKIDSDKVLHKTDKKGLVLDIQNSEELQSSVEELKNNFPGENLIVQPMLPRQLELILGIKKDSAFGSVAVFGLGGIYAEIFKAVDFVVPPASVEEIKNKISQSKIGAIFSGARGQKLYNLEELAKIISGVLSLAQELSEITELDINPLLAYNDGKEAVAVDVKIIL
jgi:acetyltransferase